MISTPYKIYIQTLGMELKGRDRKIRRIKVKPEMDWNESTRRPFVPRAESSLSFFYPYSGMEVMSQPALAETQQRLLPAMDEMNISGNREKKKIRLTSNQIELLERSFQEEVKLDPERKLKLSRELGIQPRQVAVWFQNRRTRWKNKQLEHLYDVLKHDFDVISKEKQKLQEEVMKLKAKLKEKACRMQKSAGHIEMPGEETIESTSEGLSNKQRGTSSIQQQAAYNSCFAVEDFNTVSIPHCHWPVLPHYP